MTQRGPGALARAYARAGAIKNQERVFKITDTKL